ncbi:DUF3574 domain-containing protein [Variovorax sp. W6]|uniref:DUF3574 domain-containing protein n=1 Tax=Variovorax sp. W6 TaxID=3093895 RepID=UPI003D8009EB
MTTSATLSPLRAALAVAAAALALAGCGTLPPPGSGGAGRACGSGFETFERDTLYFGRAIPSGGQVSDAEWTAFLDGTVTPAFPQGLTVIDAAGQWRGVSGEVVRERSKLVVLVHARSEKDDAAITAIVGAYRQRFAQEAVLQERQAVCVRF